MKAIQNDDEAALDRGADTLRDGLLAAGATEASLLADLRERRRNGSGSMAPIHSTVREELAALVGKSDEDIDFSDIPATTDSYWDGAAHGKFYRPR